MPLFDCKVLCTCGIFRKTTVSGEADSQDEALIDQMNHTTRTSIVKFVIKHQDV